MPLSKGTPASAWIHDFVHSTNPKFKGKSKKKRIQMALAAKYAREETNMSQKKDELLEGDAVQKADLRRTKHELDARDHEARRDWKAAKKSWKNAGLSGIKGDSARKRNTNLTLQIRGKSITKEETDMTQVNEFKYGSTHEFRGTKEFMEKCAEKVLKKHGIQIHSIETLPDEKEIIYHVSGSVDAINKASSALYDEANGKEAFKPIAYKPPKFMGSMKKFVNEETETETEEEMSSEDILAEGPQAILAGVATENPDTNDIFAAVMGAKIDSILDGLRNELAAGMFETAEEAPEVEETPEVAEEEVEVEGDEIEEGKSLWQPPKGHNPRTGIKGGGEKIKTGLPKLPELKHNGRSFIKDHPLRKEEK